MNFLGSDWVRVGASEGAVERIGLRSTSIRTVDRTVVRIPNGRLADERIETFGERDRIVLSTDIDLTYTTTPEQLDCIRDALEAALRAHPMVFADVVRVHVVGFTDSAIRITHLPTGIVVECQDERSQHKNRARAMSLLHAKLQAAADAERAKEITDTRRDLVGSGDRSEKIRTYNYPDSRVTDHRIKLTLYKLADIMNGNMDDLIQPLLAEHQADQLAKLAK